MLPCYSTLAQASDRDRWRHAKRMLHLSYPQKKQLFVVCVYVPCKTFYTQRFPLTLIILSSPLWSKLAKFLHSPWSEKLWVVNLIKMPFRNSWPLLTPVDFKTSCYCTLLSRSLNAPSPSFLMSSTLVLLHFVVTFFTMLGSSTCDHWFQTFLSFSIPHYQG